MNEYRVPEYETRRIAGMYVGCSLQTSNFKRQGVAMSDCCQITATSGVIMPDTGHIMWRCRTHEGMVDFRTDERGEVVYSVERKITSQ